jgi:hypothetical protein
LKAAGLGLFPWVFFFLRGLLPMHRHEDPESTLFLRLWAALGIAVFLGMSPDLGLILTVPPLAVLSGQLWLRETDRPSATLNRLMDLTVLLMMGLGLGATLVIFQMLGDGYPGSVWLLPGLPMLKSISLMGQTFPLPEAFPIWKLWLLPGPLLLLTSGMILFLTRLLNQPQWNAIVLFAMGGLWLAFMGWVATPVLVWPVETKLAQHVQALETTQVAVTERAHLSAIRHQLHPPGVRWFWPERGAFQVLVTPESTFYQKPDRLRYRVRAYEREPLTHLVHPLQGGDLSLPGIIVADVVE